MPFTPKFIDLVKNSTTVTGTGPVTLGSAVAGFTGIAQALQPGDQFYYCLQGVDKPAEREVGRGTYGADGKVAREPIGTAQSFTGGNKTIALVAAAEWYEQMAARPAASASGAGGPSLLFSEASGAAVPGTRLDTLGFAAAGVGAARYVFDAAVNAAYVAANPKCSFMAADNRGFRIDAEQRLTIEMFGAVANVNTSAQRAANDAALIAATRITVAGMEGISPEIHFGLGKYYLDQSFRPDRTINFVGQHTAAYIGNWTGTEGFATALVTPTGVTTVKIYGAGTDGTSTAANAAVNFAANASRMRGIGAMQASAPLSTQLGGTAHGFDIATICLIEDCPVAQVGGNGYNVVGYTNGAGRYGGPNNVSLIRPYVNGCTGNGIHFEGSDANAGTILSAEIHDANGCGIYDCSYLGNTYIAPQVTGYGNNSGGGQGQRVWYNGAVWFNIKENNLNIAPGSNPDAWHWGYVQAAAAPPLIPAWNATTTYKLTNPIFAGGPCTFFGTYVEANGGAGIVHAPASIMTGGAGSGGTNNTGALSLATGIGAVVSQSSLGRIRSAPGGAANPLYAAIGDAEWNLVGAQGTGSAEQLKRSYLLRHRVKGFDLFWGYGTNGQASSDDIELGWYNANPYFTLTTPWTAATFGRSSVQPSKIGFAEFALGNGASARLIGQGTAAPTSGNHAQGEFVLNRDPTATGVLGWSCTTGGTPGSWTAVPVAGFAGSFTGNARFTGTSDFWNAGGYGLRVTPSGDGSMVYVDGLTGAGNFSWDLHLRNGRFIQFSVGSGGNVATVTEKMRISSAGVRVMGKLVSDAPTDGIGYDAGAGGTVTQATSKSTGVTLNKVCGQVTMHGAALAAGAAASFTLSNSAIAASDVVTACIGGGASAGAYAVSVDAVANGSCQLSLRNVSGGSLSEAVAMNFAVVKAVTA